MMNVELPNGTIIEDVPDDMTKDMVYQLAIKNGLMSKEDMPEHKPLTAWEQAGEALKQTYGRRKDEVSETFKDYAEGEIGPIEAGVQTVGKGGILPTFDVAGELTLALAKDMTPDELEQAVGVASKTLMQMGLNTDTAKWALEKYNSLDKNTQKTIESLTGFGGIAANRLSKLRKIGFSKADQIKMKRLKRLLEPLDTPEKRKGDAMRGFKEDVRVTQVAEELYDLGLSPNKSYKKNINAVSSEMTKLDSKLMNRLRTQPKPVQWKTIDKKIQDDIALVKQENPIFETDKAYKDAFDEMQEKMYVTIDKHGKTPEGLLQARREFDTFVKDIDKWKDLPMQQLKARDAMAKIIRKSVNDVVDMTVPTAEVKKILNRQHMLYRAWDTLGDKYAQHKGIIETGLEFARSHPYLSLGVFSGGTSLLGEVVKNPLTLAAASIAVPSYLGYKYAPQINKGFGLFTGAAPYGMVAGNLASSPDYIEKEAIPNPEEELLK